MKLRAELAPLKERYKKEYDLKQVKALKTALESSGEYKNLIIRLAWDLLKGVTHTFEICTWYDKYNCNDTHITTLAVAALKETFPEILKD